MNLAENHKKSVATGKESLLGEEVLALLHRVLPVTGSCFYNVDDNLETEHKKIQNLEEDWLKVYREYYYEYDPLHPSIYAKIPTNLETLHAEKGIHDQKTKMYVDDFLLPQKTPYQLEIYFRQYGKIIAGASLVRYEELGKFSETEICLLRTIIPFIEFSICISHASFSEGKLEAFRFSRREREIVDLVMRGFSNKEICRHLEIELPTVKTYLSRIFNKTGSRTRTALLHQLFLTP